VSVTDGDAVVKISLPAHGVAWLDLRVRTAHQWWFPQPCFLIF
jgi:hypothetical protein